MKYIITVLIVVLLCVVTVIVDNGKENNMGDAITAKDGNVSELETVSGTKDIVPLPEETKDIEEPIVEEEKEINVFEYEFDSLEAVPDESSFFIYEPVDVKQGWLFELSGGENINVSTGTLVGFSFSERYIDVEGVNGKVRYLMNSYSKTEYGSKTQFWAAKKHVGNSIVKDFSNELINSVVLYQLDDGTNYIIGYTEGKNDSFWFLDIPNTNYFVYKK